MNKKNPSNFKGDIYQTIRKKKAKNPYQTKENNPISEI
jgi:hypothetical protein